ncbi:MAG TPA: SWIM zinc finger family protein [Bryobacteraceae bacterium]|nr:SWIM zinc finger family protein [Bryobacteraceae bacterium]
MPIAVTSDQVAALAPDAASLKASRSLATPRPWSDLGRDERAIWGACQGSAKDPYRTQIDWQGPAFKCSCPSRKFPCKHGLGLLLLLAEQPAKFTGNEPPDWVTAWLESRTQRAETKAAKESAPVDEEARAKRVEQRGSRISQGIDELELWLRDLVQQGVASAPRQPFEFWDRPAARLVDAQAPGAARRVRELAGIAASGDGWQSRMLEAVAQLTLLLHSWRRCESLTPATQADVRTAIGISLAHDEVLASEPVQDLWVVAGQRTYQEERIRVQRSWLLGSITNRTALILDFAPGTAGFKHNLLAGTVIDAEVCFFPGATPLRALIKAVHGGANAPPRVPCVRSIADAFADFGTRTASNPFIEIHPAHLGSVVPIPAAPSWLIADQSGNALPARPDFSLLAVSGGRPIDVFGEWDGHSFLPLMASANGRLTPFAQVSVT